MVEAEECVVENVVVGLGVEAGVVSASVQIEMVVDASVVEDCSTISSKIELCNDGIINQFISELEFQTFECNSFTC